MEFKNLNKQLQFYNTPSALTEKLLNKLPATIEGKTILEPSAGQGGILAPLIKKYPNNDYFYCEYSKDNAEVLKKILPEASFIANDFLTVDEQLKFDYIIANPPFSKDQDIDHFLKMTKLLKDGGTIICIMSNGWTWKSNKKCDAFKNFLMDFDFSIEYLDEKAFESIGLNIRTCIVTFTKTFKEQSKNWNDYKEKKEEKEETLRDQYFQGSLFNYLLYDIGKVPLSEHDKKQIEYSLYEAISMQDMITYFIDVIQKCKVRDGCLQAFKEGKQSSEDVKEVLTKANLFVEVNRTFSKNICGVKK
jgi:methylase of polypeptide subunit release factors